MKLFEHDQASLPLRQGQQEEIRRLGGFFVLIKEGALAPRGYGFAWRDYGSLRVWTCPVPLNLVVSWVRTFYLNVAWRWAVREKGGERRRVDMAVDRIFYLREKRGAREKIRAAQERKAFLRRVDLLVDAALGPKRKIGE